jgi:hypothetical protein
VDNRTFKRLYFKVLDYDPTRDDVIAFFRRFQFALQARQLSVRGITTDGSPLYFEHRYLFVQHHLPDSERATLHRITRGLPHLRALRDITDEIYRLFDRYCRLTRDYVGSRATVSIFFQIY